MKCFFSVENKVVLTLTFFVKKNTEETYVGVRIDRKAQKFSLSLNLQFYPIFKLELILIPNNLNPPLGHHWSRITSRAAPPQHSLIQSQYIRGGLNNPPPYYPSISGVAPNTLQCILLARTRSQIIFETRKLNATQMKQRCFI